MIIIGGVIGGVFTATESAAVACLYAFIVTFFIYREIPLSKMDEILLNALRTWRRFWHSWHAAMHSDGF